MTTRIAVITGAHLTPALELIKQLQADKNHHWTIHYLGHPYPAETHIKTSLLPLIKNRFYPISSGKLNRDQPIKSILTLPKTITATAKSLKLLTKAKPDIVVSFGGYISVPVIIAAYIKKIPSITHEQTLTTSLATKINSFFVRKIALTFNSRPQIEKLPPKKIAITGNLLRTQTLNLNSSQTYQKVKKPLFYVTGGNQGSRFINQTIKQIKNQLSQKYSIIHQTGRLDVSQYQPQTNYYPTDYIGPTDLGWVFRNARLVISRAGANTCQEIVALKKASILIPLPNSQQNEQAKNAAWVKKNLPKQTLIIHQDNLSPQKLLTAIKQILALPAPTSPKKIPPNLKLLKLIYELV